MDVIITARYGDLSVRAIASFRAAVQRARELRELGWTVDLSDESGNPVAWD